MLAAVVHADGVGAARDLLARTRILVGAPHVVGSTEQGLVAGWRSPAPLTLEGDRLVEGWLDGSLGEAPLDWDFDEHLAQSPGDYALVALACGGLIAASGPGGGHRPLFVTSQSRWVAASTRLRAILALLDCRPTLDIDYLAASVAVDSPLAESATPYRGVRHVPLAQAWLLRIGTGDIRRSTLLDLPNGEATGTDDTHAVRLRETIERAVVRATRGAAKIGVTLSGGLDSSSVMVTLENLRRTGRVSAQVEAFSWDFDTANRGDDRPFRRSVERKLGIHSTLVAPEEAAPFVRKGMVLDAMPCTDCPCPLWIALDRAACRRGVNRLVSGAGGDNVLEGNPALLGGLALRGRLIEAFRRAILLRIGYTSPWSRVRTFVVKPMLAALTPERLRGLYRQRRERRWLDWMGKRFEPWLIDRADSVARTKRVTIDSPPAERYAALACMPFLADVVLLRAQQEEATGYLRTDPLFDDEVLRFVASLPPLALFAGGYARGLLRNSMTDLLPEDVQWRLEKACIDPAYTKAVEAAGGFARFEDLARVRRLADLGLVEPKAFRKHFDRMAEHPLDGVWWSAWPALAVEEFLRQYDEGWET